MYYLVDGLAKSTISKDLNDATTRIRHHSLARTGIEDNLNDRETRIDRTNGSIEAEVGKNNNRYPYPLFFQKNRKDRRRGKYPLSECGKRGQIVTKRTRKLHQ